MELDHRGSAGQLVSRGSSRAGAKNGGSVECLASFGQGFGAWTSRRGSGEHAPAGALHTRTGPLWSPSIPSAGWTRIPPNEKPPEHS